MKDDTVEPDLHTCPLGTPGVFAGGSRLTHSCFTLLCR
jgi:hypothetical protein